MEQESLTNLNSNGWNFFVKAAFVLSLVVMTLGIIFAPVNFWIKSFMGMGSLMLVTTSIMLSKAMRDEFEARKIMNRIHEAKTERMLKEYES